VDSRPQRVEDASTTASTESDTSAWMKGFLDNFYNMDQYAGKLVSPEAFASSLDLALGASAIAAMACIPTWETDFRRDLPKIDVRLLVIQGDADRILPFPKTGKRVPDLVDDCEFVVIEDGPHAIAWTHADQVNDALLHFIGAAVPA
jgi:non-heme chloroperoxidase